MRPNFRCRFPQSLQRVGKRKREAQQKAQQQLHQLPRSCSLTPLHHTAETQAIEQAPSITHKFSRGTRFFLAMQRIEGDGAVRDMEFAKQLLRGGDPV